MGYTKVFIIYVTVVNEVSGRPQRQQVMVQGSNVKVIAKLLEGIYVIHADYCLLISIIMCMLRDNEIMILL